MTTIELENITKVFDGNVSAVSELSLSISSGEFLVLLGPSGCGKSTVLRMIAGLEEPTSGRILLNGDPADGLTPRERGAAMVFQSFALYPHMNVADNIGFPLELAGMPESERDAKAATMAAALGIGDLLHRNPAQLSGGQRQRVAMSRALVRRPSLLLMDEPLSNLDVGLRSELRAEISRLASELGVTTVYVTHDQTEALTMADRVAVMSRGRLQDLGTTQQIYAEPQTAYVAAFVGSPRMSLIEAEVQVALDQHVALHLGRQQLRLPWRNLQSRAVARYHGERVTVGVRPEAVRLGDTTGGANLAGRVCSVEHHGHESLVGVDIGGRAVMPVGLRERPPPEAASRRANRWFLGGRRRRGNEERATTAGRHHTPATQLTARASPAHTPRLGQSITLSVSLDSLHFFDQHERRIAPQPR